MRPARPMGESPMIELPTPELIRTEGHPVCERQGIIGSFKTGLNVSGHDFVQVGGDNPFNAILECRVCGYISN